MIVETIIAHRKERTKTWTQDPDILSKINTPPSLMLREEDIS